MERCSCIPTAKVPGPVWAPKAHPISKILMDLILVYDSYKAFLKEAGDDLIKHFEEINPKNCQEDHNYKPLLH